MLIRTRIGGGYPPSLYALLLLEEKVAEDRASPLAERLSAWKASMRRRWVQCGLQGSRVVDISAA